MAMHKLACGAVPSVRVPVGTKTAGTELGTKSTHCRVCGPVIAERFGGRWTCPNAKPSYRYVLLRRYGMTPESFDRMLAEQGGVCKVCREEPGVVVDHDHAKGPLAVRGILCNRCNILVGFIETSRDGIVDHVARYLNG